MEADPTINVEPDAVGTETRNALRIPDQVRAAHSADGATVLDIVHGKMFRLNFVGSRIFELLRQGLEEPEIAVQLAAEFGIERSTAEVDLSHFLECLGEHHLLTR